MKTNKASNKTVFITGGSSGIGESLVNQFAQAGYQVFFSYNHGETQSKRLVKLLSKYSVQAIQMDQGDIKSIDKAISLLPKNLDILILNAAVGTKTVENYENKFEDQDIALMKINALGPLWLTTRLLPRLKTQKPSKIIFISSVDGGINYFPGARYADGMSKAALTQFARQLASEHTHDPVDVFTVCPGATETPMLQASQLNSLSKDERKLFCDALPAKRLISTTEVAELVLFICSPAGQILRGTVIDASLGLGNNPSVIKRTKSKGKK